MPIQVEVWGDYACFTRPEMKTERVSYDVMTPSAARGLAGKHLLAPGASVGDRLHPCVQPNPLHQHPPQRGQGKDFGARRCGDGDGTPGQGELWLADVRRASSSGRPWCCGTCDYVIDAHFDMTDAAALGDNRRQVSGHYQAAAGDAGSATVCPTSAPGSFPAQFRRCTELPPCPEELKGTRDLGWMLWDHGLPRPGEHHAALLPGQSGGRRAESSAAEQRGGARMILQALDAVL